jgi:hypothetical protein
MNHPYNSLRVGFFAEIVVKCADLVPNSIWVSLIPRKITAAAHSESLRLFYGKKSFEGIGSGTQSIPLNLSESQR